MSDSAFEEEFERMQRESARQMLDSIEGGLLDPKPTPERPTPESFEALVAQENADWYGAPEDVLVEAWNLAIEAAAAHLEEQAREYVWDVEVCMRAQAGEIRKLKRKAGE